MDPLISSFFVLVRDPKGFGSDFAAFEKGLGKFITDTSIDTEFVHDKAVHDSRAGEGGGGEQYAEGRVGADKEELMG